MKELSIEQKAKAYDKALKVLHKYDGAHIMFTQDLKEEMFPELAETEDEKIKKELIKALETCKWCGNKYWSSNLISIDDALAWLEKQGEQKPAVDTKVVIPKFRVGDIVKSKSQPMLSPRKIISIGKDCYWCEDRGCIGFAWEDDCEIVEQKTAGWSEEDEENLNWFEKFFRAESVIAEGKDIPQDRYLWFKNLKGRVQPQNTWKPSDEQMDALRYVTNFDYGGHKATLVSLYEQLKKL